MSIKTRTCEEIECDLCHSIYDRDSEDGRAFSKIPIGGCVNDRTMDVCKECFDGLMIYFKRRIAQENECEAD